MDNINQYLQQALEESQDAILIADRQGIIRYWNAGAERILGYSG
jgi:PAS domain S-box-containing protein